MLRFVGIIGTADEVVVYTSGDISEFDEHVFQSHAGVVTVECMVDGVWTLTDLAFTDLSSLTPATKVLVTAGQTQVYRLSGKFEAIRFRQEGATAANVRGAHIQK